ncbi:MAG: MBL fold metallo-hydrolase [Synergistaceae bacterium]|jgi:glyoxylase-like metal-dependent hydrolase (beta-lactamase superfamily II)|nr:MBL fold metallo-hydrolase [Synergistaceae bacterium]
MYELIQLGDRTYYIDCSTKIGVYKINETDVCFIDSGVDGNAGERALSILDERGWSLKMIINTHSHADHTGGNNFLQTKTGCRIYARGADVSIIHDTILNTSFIYGGYPFQKLMNRFLYASPSEALEIQDSVLPDGMETINLDGHSFSMTGIRTSDGVCFVADSVMSVPALEKYHIPFIYDAKKHLETLSALETLDADIFVPSHFAPMKEVKSLAGINRDKVLEVMERVLSICEKPVGFDEMLGNLFDSYELVMDMNQYILVSSTLRSLLSYLYDMGRVSFGFDSNKLLWESS